MIPMTSDGRDHPDENEVQILKDDDFVDLEQRYAMHVLLMIHRYPGCLKVDIADLSDPAHNTKYSRVQYLVDKGYVSYMNVNGRQTKRMQLTEKGKRVAECVDRIHDILREYD